VSRASAPHCPRRRLRDNPRMKKMPATRRWLALVAVCIFGVALSARSIWAADLAVTARESIVRTAPFAVAPVIARVHAGDKLPCGEQILRLELKRQAVPPTVGLAPTRRSRSDGADRRGSGCQRFGFPSVAEEGADVGRRRGTASEGRDGAGHDSRRRVDARGFYGPAFKTPTPRWPRPRAGAAR